jgi:YHS domain-containing protein
MPMLGLLLSLLCFSNASVVAAQEVLTKVPAEKVCMVNDKVFSEKQIPVEVDGKMYYGCCEMCEAKLKNNRQSRFASDPISKKLVDKATAVIGANENGKVFYFENEVNLSKFTLEN